MKKGICVKTKNNTWAIRYKCPEGAGLAYCEIEVQSESYPYCEENKLVEFELIPYHYVSGGLQPFTVDLIGGKGLQHHEGNLAKIIHIQDFELFNPNTRNHEVFAIKGDQAFVGYKLPNGDFHFEQIPYTEPKDKSEPLKATVLQRIEKYIEEQIKFKNVEDYHSTWLSGICQYWYNQGKLDK